MQTVASLMARARNDPYLQAFQLRRLCRSSPLSVLANAEEFTGVLAQLDGPLAADIIEDLAGAVERLASESVAGTHHPGFARFLIKLLAADGRWFIQVRCIKHLARA